MSMKSGLISIASNSVGVPTGYGQQAELLARNLLADGHKVASMSNYGLEGIMSEITYPEGVIPHYPRGLTMYSDDVLPAHHEHFKAQHKGFKDLILTLYDVWVYENERLKDFNIASWTPIDHITIPPKVLKWVQKPNVTPIAMAPNGKRLFDEASIDSIYIPHSVDTSIYKYSPEWQGQTIRKFMHTEGKFVVGMVAANKANGQIHRKAFGENLLAFSIFKKDHPDAVLYLHTEVSRAYNGFDILKLLSRLGIKPEDVILPHPYELRFGFPQEQMAAFYSGMDVLLATSYGEGFGVPTMEAQACGTRVIGSSWAATPDLLSEDCWAVDGQPFWNEAMEAWFQIPKVDSIVKALEMAYSAPRSPSEASIKFAADFDSKKVYQDFWKPALKKLLK